VTAQQGADVQAFASALLSWEGEKDCSLPVVPRTAREVTENSVEAASISVAGSLPRWLPEYHRGGVSAFVISN